MAKKLTQNKAKEILHDKSVHGHPLTDKQRKFFGAIAGGAKPYEQAQIGTSVRPISLQNVQDFFEMLSVPQKAATKVVTGKYQTPSEAMGIKNEAGAMVTDILLDPMNILSGAGLLKAKGVFKNANKLNPLALKVKPKKKEEGGWLDKYVPKAQNGIEGTMGGLTDKGFNYNGAWGGTMQDGGNLMPAMAGANQTVPMFQMGGSLPGAVGFTYARTVGAAPSNGPYAKKTKASAQTGDYIKKKVRGIEDDLQEKYIEPEVSKAFELADKEGIGYGKRNGPLDAVRHAASASKVASSVPVLGMPIANVLGIAHEISANRGNTKELFSDLYNNFIGSVIGSVPFVSDDTRRNWIIEAQKKGILSTIDNKKPKLPSFQDGGSMKYYQEGLDFKPKTISQDGSEIPVDPDGYWNPENWGNPVIIPSNIITMEDVFEPLLGISNTGDVQYMEPGEDYEFDGEYVTEYPIARGGISVNNADAQPIKKLDQLLNFTNYNKPTKGGWLDKYN